MKSANSITSVECKSENQLALLSRIFPLSKNQIAANNETVYGAEFVTLLLKYLLNADTFHTDDVSLRCEIFLVHSVKVGNYSPWWLNLTIIFRSKQI